MKKNGIIILALLSGILSAETVQIDLAAGKIFQFIGKQTKGEKNVWEAIRMVDVSGKKLPQAVWDVKKSPYLRIRPKERLTFNQFDSLVFKLKLEVPQGCPISAVNLRFVDKDREIFQYRQGVNLRNGGIFDVEIPLDKKHLRSCWSGNPANKTVDLPLKFSEIVFDYPRKTTQEIKITILGITAENVDLTNTAVARPVYLIGDCTRYSPVKGKASLQTGSNILKISGLSNQFRFREKKDPLTPYTDLIDGLEVEGCVLNGTAAIRAGFRDSAKKLHVTSAAKLTGKRNRVFLQFPSAAAVKYPLFLDWLELDNTEKTPADAEIYAVSYVLQQNILQAVDLSIATDTSVGVLRKGHEDKFKFNFINRSGIKGDYAIHVIMRHYSGKELHENILLTLPPGKEICVLPKNKPDLWGHWDVIAEIHSKINPKGSIKKTTSFAYLNPAGPTPGRAPGFLFGICTHTGRWSTGEQAKEVEALSLCGAKIARCGSTWSSMQPNPGEWQWEKLDSVLNAYNAAGIELQYMLGYPPKWAAREELRNQPWVNWNRSAPEDTVWRKYVEEIVSHYRGKIFYWEHWNEPDMGIRMTNAEYVRLQKSAFEVIRRVAPEAVVMTGGFGKAGENHARMKNKNFYHDFFTGAKGAFDVHAIHEHGSFAAYQNVIDNTFFPMRAKYGIKGPWYANETAIHSMDGAVRLQAETLFKKLLFSWARGAIGYTWYDLRNDGFRHDYPEHQYGMMTNDFVPKPVYSVFNMLAGTFRLAKFVRQWNPGNNLWVFEFQDGANRYIAAWDESAFAASHPLRIVTDAKSAAKIDLMGNKTDLPLQDGLCIFEVGSEPCVLEVSGGKALRCEGELIEIAGNGIAVPGIRYPVRTVIYNPWKQNVVYTLSIAAETKKIQVEPGKNAVLDFTPIPAREALILNWRNSIGMKGIIPIPVYAAKIIPSGSFDKRQPDFVLNTRKQVVSLVEALPETAHRVWKDAMDQSVNGWVGVTGNELQFRFNVTDDIHKQPYSGSTVYKGDNIQLALVIPGQAGYWEFGFSRLDNGESAICLWGMPSGFDAESVKKDIRLITSRSGNVTQYQIVIPLSALQTTAKKVKAGIRLNFIVNENDGEGRDGWLQYAPGIGTVKDSSRFPMVIFR